MPLTPSSTRTFSTYDLDGEPLFVVEQGQGAPVLLIHGLIATSHVFAEVVDQDKERHRMIAVDLPCSGKSGSFCAYEPAAIADACIELLDALELDQAIVVGHSYGGVVALEIAMRAPKRVKALGVLAAPALGLASYKRLLSLGLTEKLWSKLGGFTKSARLLTAYLKMLWGDAAGPSDKTVDAYLAGMQHEGSAKATLDAARALAHYRLDVDKLKHFTGPREVMWGDRDRLVPIFHGEHLAKTLNVPLTILDGAGHFLPEERPAEVLALIERLSHARAVAKPKPTRKLTARPRKVSSR